MTGDSSSLRKPYLGFTGKWLTVWITVACATDMTLFGYDQGVFSGVVVTQDYLDVLNLGRASKTKLKSTVTAIYDFGCFFGAIIALKLGERIGRKNSILVGTATMAIWTILQASAFNLAQMFIGRIVLGLGNGINTVCAPLLQAETASPRWRGRLVMLELVMNIAGFAMVNWINYYGLSFVGGSVAWRLPIALQFIFIFIFILFATVPWLPESHRWLMSHDMEAEPIQVLAALEDKPVNDPQVSMLRNEIGYSIHYERENAVRWTDLLRFGGEDSTKTRCRLLLAAGTQFMQQFEGINVMSYYLPTVLEDSVGLSDSLARLLTACNASTYFVFSCLSVPLIEKFGRRGLMMMSTFGQFVAFLIITILLRAESQEGAGSSTASASVAFFFIFYICFGMGMLGIPWLYPTEISSLALRTKSAAVATATNWICNFIIVEITPIAIQNIGWRFWIVFTVFNACFLPVIYLFYPETVIHSHQSSSSDVINTYKSYSKPYIGRHRFLLSRKSGFILHEEAEMKKNMAAGNVKMDKSAVERRE
ncbi:hypothetical protein N7488_009581 [Penicillium malachiteum]|nr:hypothetical protein N7488_009581 [Penicillium malachiteum]